MPGLSAPGQPPGGAGGLPDLRLGGLFRRLTGPTRQGALRGDRPSARPPPGAGIAAVVLRPPASGLTPAGRWPHLRLHAQPCLLHLPFLNLGASMKAQTAAAAYDGVRPFPGSAAAARIGGPSLQTAVTGLIVTVPFAGLAAAVWLLPGTWPRARRPAAGGRFLHRARAGSHRRFPPPHHAPQLHRPPVAADHAGDRRINGIPGRRDRLGSQSTAATTPSPTAPVTRTPPTGTAPASPASSADWPTPTSAGCSATTPPPPPATPPTCSPTRR